MNDRYLFRGKRTDNGEWVEEFYVCLGGMFHYILTGKLNIDGNYIGFEKYEVDPETVGQYTGLTDKNGNRIFEGDIVLQPVREKRKHSPCVIEFRKGTFMAHYKSENRFFDRHYDINSFTKVIGNIHDNPELLKGE